MHGTMTSQVHHQRPLGPRVLLRSAGVGVVATVVDLAALWLLVSGVGLSPLVANVPALSAGLVVQFFGNKRFAFRDRSPRIVRQGALFLLVEAGAFALNALAFDFLVRCLGMGWAPARLLGSAAVYLGFSFPLWRFVFHTSRSPYPPSEGASL